MNNQNHNINQYHILCGIALHGSFKSKTCINKHITKMVAKLTKKAIKFMLHAINYFY